MIVLFTSYYSQFLVCPLAVVYKAVPNEFHVHSRLCLCPCFRAMKETWSEAEVVLQPPLSQKEMNCAEQVAKELDLLTEKVSVLFQVCRCGCEF